MKEKRFIMSSERLNSYGFWVKTDGIDFSDFIQNPVGFINHETCELPPIKWKDVKIEGSNLVGTAIFDENDEDAIEAYSKVEGGFLNGASIGISILEYSESPEYLKAGQTNATVTKCKLRECSVVSIPSNKDALAIRLYDKNEGYVTLSDSNLSNIVPTVKNKNMFEKLVTLGYKDADAVLSELDATKKAVKDLQDKLAAFEVQRKEAEKNTVKTLCEKKGMTTQEVVSFTKLAEADFETTIFVLNARPDYVSVTDAIAGKAHPANSVLAKLHDRKDWNYNDWATKDSKGLSELKAQQPAKFEEIYQSTFAQ